MRSPADIIRLKRNGEALEAAVLEEFITGVTDGRVGDGQLGAFLMAVWLQGMTAAETAALTLAMRDSGSVLSWPGLDGPVVDKHSTGGVGDLVSLVLAPLLAACGAYVPMISGRGLGHTGGTLDKLESIPGYDVSPDRERLERIVRTAGCAIVGQSPALAPADRRMYAMRDVTATVSCTPLIVSSILSKKLAAGLGALVMDVKVGNGAIFADEASARQLAQALCDVSAAAGLPCRALLTDMNEPLAPCAGNAVEVREAIRFLTGEQRDPRLLECVLALASELLLMSGVAESAETAVRRLRNALEGGAAAERFAAMVRLQGGPRDLLERPAEHLPSAPCSAEAPAGRGGFVVAVDTRELGRIVHGLGGGRHAVEDRLDHAAGLTGLRRVGEAVAPGSPLAVVHGPSREAVQAACARVIAAVRLDDTPPAKPPLLLGRIDGNQEES